MTFILIISISGAIILVFCLWLLTLELRLRKFFKGEDGKNLEKALSDLIKKSDKLERRMEISEGRIEHIEQKLKNCLRKTKVVRFNPFKDAGGNQSFSMAWLDEEKNGIVLSSLYGREINRIYAKPIEKGKSQYQLSEEEKEAIK